MSSQLDLANLLPGFVDPARDSQKVFREVMNATAQPGRLAALGFAPKPPKELSIAAGAVCLAVLDHETPLWLHPRLRRSEAENWIRFHTGAALTEVPGEAAFALLPVDAGTIALSSFNQGEAKYPDRATTVILMLDALDGGNALTLRGPGIASTTTISPAGLPEGFWEERAELVSHFQFGIDLMMCAGAELISLPRTTRITSKES